jgi:hypothetical protein
MNDEETASRTRRGNGESRDLNKSRSINEQDSDMRKVGEAGILRKRDPSKADYCGQQYLNRNKSEFRKLQKEKRRIGKNRIVRQGRNGDRERARAGTGLMGKQSQELYQKQEKAELLDEDKNARNSKKGGIEGSSTENEIKKRSKKSKKKNWMKMKMSRNHKRMNRFLCIRICNLS